MTDYPFNADKPVKADTIANFCIYTEQNDEHLFRSLIGFARRSRFAWKDADEIYINPGCYHHYGSTRNRLVWWNSAITFKFGGAAGSNALSDELGNNEWHYLFIDDSAVNTLASNELNATCFLNDTTAPTWSDTYHGWYTGNDRCIAAFLTGASANVLEFFHEGDLVIFADAITTAINGTNLATDFSDEATLSIPAFARKALVTIGYTSVGGSAATMSWRTEGQSGSAGHTACSVSSTSTTAATSLPVIASSNLKIDVKDSAACANIGTVITDGWYFPIGM